MNTLKLDLENCYGIKKLEHEFSFSQHHTQLIYAPNGMMKSSFALTLKGLSGQSKEVIKDRLHPSLISKYDVSVDGTPILKEQVFVADPEDDSFDSSGVFTNFLADASLKTQYDSIYKQLDKYVSQIITPLRDVSISSDCEDELFRTFADSPSDNLFSILERLSNDVQAQSYQNFGFRYNYVFDRGGKVKKFLENNAADLQNYINQYNNLISTSPVFRTVGGKTFGTYQASELSKSIESGEFFSVNHRITLQDGTVVSSADQLNKIFDSEKERILSDESLKKSFDKITKAADSNNEVRVFKDVLIKNPTIIVELADYEGFRKKVWKGYLSDAKVKQFLLGFNTYYQSQKPTLSTIISQARAQLPIWQNILQIYRARFHVPFKVEIENQDDIILKQAAAKLVFKYVDEQHVEIERGKQEMLHILSRGEQRAFYILQLLFELESRKSSGRDNLIVFDDISDSFDYQNKYAIIEYLRDLDALGTNIYLIVLTHNFDFYRTLSSRLGLRSCSWMAIKETDGKIVLKQGQYQKDLFTHFITQHSDNKVFVSMIPFVRNLVDYIEGDSSPDYLILTSCLHLKPDTMTITDDSIINIVKKFNKGRTYARVGTGTPVFNTIIATADAILSESVVDEVMIENKIVLSMACRLKTEQYIKRQLLAVGLVESDLIASSRQTTEWISLLKRHCPNDSHMSIVERVNMLSPEFIHINSFMYEPLIDLSVHHLLSLYREVTIL